ncbi:MAG: hypothetical protein HQL26_10225 [Candidatus Omnitrophica bacterium]|nr:hypothetical protein [Candidatus Omnitrophota bacterium]
MQPKYIKIFLVLFFLPSLVFASEIKEWQQKKSEHFVVYYTLPDQDSLAGEVSRMAEHYYKVLGELIGYIRYENFWTWDQRALIYIYADQKNFMQKTGQPAWSSGGSADHSYLLKNRVIVTYVQADGFIDGVLPHEITHLVMRDFWGTGKDFPQWFDEGMAQLNETHKRDDVNRIFPKIIKIQGYIPIQVLQKMDVYRETDKNAVAIFYGQSLSMVDFMIKIYGADQFAYFCRQLRDGGSFEESLRRAYPAFSSLEEFEKKWLRYMKNK